MRSSLIFVSTLILSLTAGLGGYSLFHHWSGDGKFNPANQRPQPGPSTAEALNKPRPPITLADVDGVERDIAEWDGKTLIVNFWATWCPPCRREIPAFADIHREYADRDVVVLGIAIDDPERVAPFIERFEVPYPNLVGQGDAASAAAALGNASGSLPFTAIIARDGIVKYLHLGEIDRATLVEKIDPLL